MFDGKAIGELLIPIVREYVSKTIGGLADRLGALEKRISDMPIPKDGRDGIDGKDGSAGLNGKDGANGLDGAKGDPGERGPQGERGEQGPPGEPGPAGINGKDGKDGIDGKDGAAGLNGKDGADGLNGKDGAPGPRGEQGLQGEKGADGINGKDGAAGLNGKDGANGVNGKDGAPGERGADGLHGKDGRDGVDGKDGSNGLNGKDGLDGKDGKSVTLDEVRPILEGEIAKWALDFERRAADSLQRVVDRMPIPKDGLDGFTPEDFDVSFDDDCRTLNITMRTAEKTVTKSVTLPVPLDRGKYTPGMKAHKGDGITYGGSFWIAQRETTDSPGSSDAWRLAVKHGRDAK